MNAPATPAATAQQTTLPRNKLLPSATNPRTRRGLDAESLRKLADSIKDIGIMQPIVIRPADHSDYEIICGERRWRAAALAELDDVPVLIRDLTDEQVVKMQLTENKQREDLDEMEEAEGYERLMKQADSQGNAYTAERIAVLMGVSKGTIYARLKLLALCPEAREAFYDGKLDASRALLIARIPVHKLQIKALKEITEPITTYREDMMRGEPMSYRKARQLLQEQYMTDLARAAFDTTDPDLLPRAGSCTACLNRTGNAGELFDDVGNKDVCIDQTCFAAKKLAHVQRIQKEAESRGDTLILKKDAKKIIPKQYSHVDSQLQEHGLIKLDALIPDDEKGRTWEQVLSSKKLLANAPGSAPIQRTIIENPNKPGEMITAINIEDATKALREAGFEIKPRSPDQNAILQQAQHKKEADKINQAVEAERLYRKRLLSAIRESILTPGKIPAAALYGFLAKQTFSAICEFWDTEDLLDLARIYDPTLSGDDDRLVNNAFIDALTPQQQFMLALDALIADDLDVWARTITQKEPPDRLIRLAEIEGINAPAIKKQAAADAKAEAKKAETEAAKEAK